jgi:ribosomal protein S21
LEGDYNGILKADEHYISVKKDFSNIEEAIRRFKDESYRETMVRRTHEYALEEHTYDRRVQGLVRAVLEGSAFRPTSRSVA